MNADEAEDLQCIKKFNELIYELVALGNSSGKVEEEKLTETFSMLQQLLGHVFAPSIDEMAEVHADKYFLQKLFNISVQNNDWLMKKVNRLEEQLKRPENCFSRIMKTLNDLVSLNRTIVVKFSLWLLERLNRASCAKITVFRE